MQSQSSQNRTLPRDISAFTGRTEELERIQRAVTSATGCGVIGICAIGGMAGLGKTTLAVHAAHALAPKFPDGQIFVALHAHTPGQRPADPADVLATLLLAAGMDARQIPADRDGRERCWRDYLAGRKVLLVLDDATGHEQVRPLLPGGGGSAAMVTSRQRLTALEDASAIDLDTMPEQDAARLLIRLAARTGLRADDPGVREITRLCGYLPLAIGMLARQLHHHPFWTSAGLAAALAAARNRPEMMRNENLSVAAAFDLSYRDLTAAQRRMFRRLGLHPGPDVDAYAAAALADVGLATARRQLDALYDQYLITEPAAGRYRLHDLVRDHARALASDSTAHNESAVARDLDYYLHTALEAAKHIPSWPTVPGPTAPGQPAACRPAIASTIEAIDWMESERANLYAAASYAAETSRHAYTIALSVALAGFLEARGPWDKAVALQYGAIAAAEKIEDSVGLAINLILLAGMQAASDPLTAAVTSERALQIYRDLGDLAGQAETIGGLAELHALTGRYQLAAEYVRRAISLFTDIGEHRGQANALCDLGALQQAVGDYPAAFACYRQARQLSIDLDDRWVHIHALIGLGILERLTGDYGAAKTYQREALELADEYQDRYRLAFITNELGVLQRLSGAYQASAVSLGHAHEQFRDLGQIHNLAMASNEIGLLRQLTGDYQAAAASHHEALTICTELRMLPGQAEVLNSLGELATRTRDPIQAREYHTRAFGIARELPSPLEEARALEGIGRSNLGYDKSEAEVHLRRALEIYQRLGSPGASRVQEMLADLAVAQASDPE